MTQDTLIFPQEFEDIKELPLTQQADFFRTEVLKYSSSSTQPNFLANQLSMHKNRFPGHFPLGLYPKQDNVDFVYDNMDAEDQFELNQFKYKINLPGIDATTSRMFNEATVKPLSFYKKDLAAKNVDEDDLARIEMEASMVSNSLDWAMPDYDDTKRQDFLHRFALQYYSDTSEIPTAQDILETLVLPQYYMIRPPGNPDIHVLYPRYFVVPHAELTTKDLEFANDQLLLELKNKSNFKNIQNQYAAKFGTDEGSLGVFIAPDNQGYIDYHMYDRSAPKRSAPLRMRMTFKKYSRYARRRIELAMLEDIDSLLVAGLNLFDDKATIAKGLIDGFETKIKAKRVPFGSRSLESVFPRISFTGSFENHYEVDPSLFDFLTLTGQDTIERVIPEIFRDLFSGTTTRIGIIEYNILNEFLAKVDANPAKDIDDIHQEMVDKRFKEDESFFGMLMRKIDETEQGIKRQIEIVDENIKLRK